MRKISAVRNAIPDIVFMEYLPASITQALQDELLFISYHALITVSGESQKYRMYTVDPRIRIS